MGNLMISDLYNTHSFLMNGNQQRSQESQKWLTNIQFLVSLATSNLVGVHVHPWAQARELMQLMTGFEKIQASKSGKFLSD